MVACSEFNTTYNKSALPFAQSCFWGKTGGGSGSPGERLREAGEERAGGGSLQGAGSGRPR